MLERIVLNNFQKHEHLDVSFEKGFNLITGCNGWGKSAILRAIQWVTVNDGDSKSFRRTYLDGNGNVKVSKETSVELYIDSRVIKRVYSASKNEYYLDGIKLTGFGRDVPNEVKEVCQMQDFNFSEQFAPLFLIGDSSGGSIARELAEIASLEEMDVLTNTVNSDIRQYKEKVDDKSAVLESMLSDASIFDSYASIFNDIDADAKLYIEDSIVDSTRFTGVLQAYNALQRLPSVSKGCLCELCEVESSITDADFFITDITYIQECIDRITSMPDVTGVCECVLACESMFNESDFSEDTRVADCDRVVKSYETVKQELKKVTDELDVVQKELDTFTVCPLCGNELKECTHE